MKKIILLCLFFLPLASGCSVLSISPEADAIWRSSIRYDENGRAAERFIPVHLFVGAEWDGSQELILPEIKREQAPNGAPLWIFGPVPCCGSTKPNSYKRSRDSKMHGGHVTQYFTIHKDKNSLVLEEQYQTSKKQTKGFGKFPLGWWEEGETRMIRGKKVLSTLEIEKLDFNYQGIPHSLQFRFKLLGSYGKGTDCSYVFSPSWGLVSVDCHEKIERFK